MKLSDRYHKWVEWSEEDATYLGKCPDLMTGSMATTLCGFMRSFTR